MTREVYAVADAAHLPGLVALVNSLRRTGYDGEIIVGDLGMGADDRRLLEREVTVEQVDRRREAQQLKTVLPRRGTADVRVLIDADIIMLEPLDDLLAGRRASVLAFADPLTDRFCPEWAGLGLGRPEPGVYVNTGLLVLDGATGAGLLETVHGLQPRLRPDRFMTGPATDPFYYADQDLWNAVLSTADRRRHLDARDSRLAPHPPFGGLRRAAYADGTRPILLHHTRRKPWLTPTRPNAYTREFQRLVLGPGGPLRLDPRRLPARLRAGAVGRAAAGWAGLQAAAHAQRGRLGLRRRLGALRPGAGAA